MSNRITFLPAGTVLEAKDGETILAAAIRAGVVIDAPCGGQGSCGKCIVDVVRGAQTGRRRACQTVIAGDTTVVVPQPGGEVDVLCAGEGDEVVPAELSLRAARVQVEPCRLGENRADWQRLTEAAAPLAGVEPKEIPFSLEAARGLFAALEQSGGQPGVVVSGTRLLDVRADLPAPLAAAFDIGTTTVVCYLLDARSGAQLAVEGVLNPQTQYGADVISRAMYAIQQDVQPLTDAVRGAMNELLQKTAARAGVQTADIYRVAVAGNTCMHHLFAGICPQTLVSAPYYASFSAPVCLTAAQSGLAVNRNAEVWLLPNLAGFVGADTCALMLSAGFDELEELTLAVDIGTNGEMVLGDKTRRIACSTAAGPAFEGAKIEKGMRASAGAIDRVRPDGAGDIALRTIEGAPAAGICGSGLIDAAACLVKLGVVEKSGRFAKKLPEPLAARRCEIDGKQVFVLAREAEAKNGEPVYLTQKDVREIQLAKGAISAGIRLMCETLGVQVGDIRQVLLAGAFGSYIDPQSACTIGLLPAELQDRVRAIGNAAGEGAKLAALSDAQIARCDRITRETQFLELATHPNFQNTFVKELNF